MPTDLQTSLSPSQRDAILELGSRGSGGLFDPLVMSQLFVLGLVEVRNEDRRLVLTERGRLAYDVFMAGGGGKAVPQKPK